MLPTVTLPKVRLDGLGVRSPAEIPVPDRGILNDPSEASEVTVTVPLAAPDAEGVNVTLKLVLAPAANVTGVVIPLKLNPVPVAATLEIVTVDPPVFVIFSDSD